MELEEEWRDIAGYEGVYRVSNFGRVVSLKYGKTRILGTRKTGGGVGNPYYISVVLFNRNVRRPRSVHSLVLEAFVGPRPRDFVACHNDGDTFNNRLDNLRWDTQKSNCADKRIHGTNKCGDTRGSRHGASKLSEASVLAIRARHAQGESQKLLAEEFSVTPSTIWGIVRGKRWRHI